MSTGLLLLRHADSWHKREGIVGGARGDRGLTPEGVRQAERLRDRLARQGLEAQAVYSSPLPRAQKTAEVVTRDLNLPSVLLDPGLISWAVPEEADGIPTQEFQTRYATPGGVFHPFESVSESWASLVTRASYTLLTLARRHPGQTTLVFTHAEVVKASFVAFGNLPLLPPFEVEVRSASVTEWRTEGDPAAWPPPAWTLVRLNDAAHLEGGEL
ncbi:histidine phosphatase family protein [Deinococcus apachensis]|uniref:histidine phosphatase family protein n=1 Tax=Deinococcus apachensis TaxID=309886 RepID=UPI00037D10DE|nr:histidine phosphatase family protein [Deinococcus apachensis]